ncbi:hypothetical protein [Rossellomorea aquimaris]|uniref:DUF91 domain-containing protein n=1 Tax=Rossellomorea aquimaris TaxID=189382 RepID=A0A5D4TL52_9BACI|nr:hypothetical protein [Rossellomorea aquimaris]TYS76593.1 hypothetical protein FZC80_14920 [Rossellomorea aquimaris]
MYKLNSKSNELEEVFETTFFENDLRERQHIQEWIRKNPEVLGEELMILTCEYDKFEVNERLDLLALDKEGNLTVIEVKRDTTGSNVDFQALKYASYCARLSPVDVMDIFFEYINSFGLGIDSKEKLVEFLELEDEEELHSSININQRIIIVGKEIDKRILSVCTWLHENSIDIKCVTIKPYKLPDEQIIVDTNQIIPPYKLEDYYISKKEVKQERKKTADNDVREFLQSVSNFINKKTDYSAKYGGNRDYFKGHKFHNLPWRFVFAYKKKDGQGLMLIESDKDPAVEVIRHIVEKHLQTFSEVLGSEVELVRGVKNTKLYKLVVKIEFPESQPLEERINIFNDTFVKYKSYLETVLNEISH